MTRTTQWGPVNWAKRAIDLNPGHPDHYNLGLGFAALFAGDFELARRAARDAPPVPEALVTLAAAEALLGDGGGPGRLRAVRGGDVP